MYGGDIIFTAPFADIRRVANHVRQIHVHAPYMDWQEPGRGVASILPESVFCAGATGVMLNHCEKPLSLSALTCTIKRARQIGLTSMVCASSLPEVQAVVCLRPDIVVAEPEELIGTGTCGGGTYVESCMSTVRRMDPHIPVLVGAGIRNGDDVYQIMLHGADGTGSSSGIALANDRRKMILEMADALWQGWNDREKSRSDEI